MSNSRVAWTTFKTVQARDKFPVYHKEFDASKGIYDVYGSNGRFFFEASVGGLGEGTDGQDFVDTFLTPALSTEVPNRDDAMALALPAAPLSKSGAPLSEPALKQGIPGAEIITVVTHDFADPTTWYQQATEVGYGEAVNPKEELTPEGGTFTPGTTTRFDSANPLWINIDHPNLFFDQDLNPAYIGQHLAYQADPGSNPPPDPNDLWYYGPWKPDGTKYPMSHFRPILEVDPAGLGNWQVAEPDDPTYGHRRDYVNGRVHFLNTSGFDAGFKARMSYFYAQETADGSKFSAGPCAAKRRLLPITEVQLSKGARWRDTILLRGMGIGLPMNLSLYKTYFGMQSTATAKGTTFDGTTASPEPWPAAEENGWPYPDNLYDGKRNTTKPLEIIRWEYEEAYDLLNSLGATLEVLLASGKKFADTDGANVTYYFTELPE